MTRSAPLRVYADRELLPAGVPHTTLLYPFWGVPPADPRSPTSGRFDRYVERATELIELVEPDRAELCVLPAAWEHLEDRSDAVDIGRSSAELAGTLGVPLVVVYVSDSEAPVPIEDAWVYHTSLRRSRRRPLEIAMPALSMDVARQELGGAIEPRPGEPQPVVGFCAYAPGAEPIRTPRAVARAFKRRLRVASGSLAAGVFARARALRVLERNPRVRLTSIVRDAFWAGAVVPGRPDDYALMAAARKDFVENLRDCDYALCARGGGNVSYRLYEAMSSGRIPVFVDTDCVLPFEDEIDWRSLCVWVDESDVACVGDRFADFHAALGADGFAVAQRACRRVWEEHLSPEGFFRQFGRSLVGRAA